MHTTLKFKQDDLRQKEKRSLAVPAPWSLNGRAEFLMAQEEGTHQGMNPLVPPVARETTPETKDPGRGPAAAGPHHSCVSRRDTFVFFYCGVSDGHCIDVFIRGMFSLCLSDHLVCVFQHVFLSFVFSQTDK